jgi:hypothetical protein
VATIPHEFESFFIVRMDIVIAPLLLVGGSCSETVWQKEGRWIIHIPTTHFISGKPNGVTEPFPRHPNGHSQPKANLRMEKRTVMIVLCEILDESGIFLGELVYMLSQRDSGSIHDRQVISKGLQEFYVAILEHDCSSLLVIKSLS